ncbi:MULTISPECIES: hypothetical protein [unclassified Bradyrhizobium]|uniref:hypothetical protein n=1 Tax=unclassified Bradyrhizobium TaxID=2631580 RepID=UPI003395D6E5
MKKLIPDVVALTCVGIAGPAMAERIVIKEGPGYHHHHRHFRAYNSHGCRTVVIRDRRPNGNVVVRHIRRCH